MGAENGGELTKVIVQRAFYRLHQIRFNEAWRGKYKNSRDLCEEKSRSLTVTLMGCVVRACKAP